MTENGFFRGHKRRGSYDLFSSYNSFLPGWGGAFILLILFLLGSLISIGIIDCLNLMLGQTLTMKYGMLIAYPISFFPALLYGSAMSRLNEHRVTADPLDRKFQNAKKSITLIFSCVIATIASAYIVEPISLLLPEMPKTLKDTMELLLNGMPFWATLLSVSVFAPLFEEWLCRGLILRGLLHKTSPALAVFASALFFAVIHGNLWQAIPAFALGLLFGYAYYKTRSLKLTILMHCANNTLAACLSKVPQFKDTETFMDVLSPWAYWSIFGLCILIVFSCLVILKNAPQPQDCQVCQHQ